MSAEIPCIQIDIVQATEGHDGKPPQPLVPVDERTVANPRVDQGGTLEVQVRIRLAVLALWA